MIRVVSQDNPVRNSTIQDRVELKYETQVVWKERMEVWESEQLERKEKKKKIPERITRALEFLNFHLTNHNAFDLQLKPFIVWLLIIQVSYNLQSTNWSLYQPSLNNSFASSSSFLTHPLVNLMATLETRMMFWKFSSSLLQSILEIISDIRIFPISLFNFTINTIN